MNAIELWDAWSNLDLANCLIYMKDFDKASEILIETTKKNENVTHRHHKVHIEFKIKFLEALSMIMNKDIENAYITIHKMKEILEKQLKIDAQDSHLYYPSIFTVYFYLGDIDSGYTWYYKDMKEQNSACRSIIYDPWCANAHKDPRYIEILKEMKLYDYLKDSLNA